MLRDGVGHERPEHAYDKGVRDATSSDGRLSHCEERIAACRWCL